tara:strand:- start:43 stop:210 length:168 start_codon:yes stop_codon:yes gene_type:complete
VVVEQVVFLQDLVVFKEQLLVEMAVVEIQVVLEQLIQGVVDQVDLIQMDLQEVQV